MRILRPVVCPQSPIVNHRQLFFANGDSIRFEFVRRDTLWRKSPLLQELSQQLSRRFGAASWLNQEVQNFTFVVNRPP